ncbi:AbrB/MazE/SpoVT family DNA-binding domain-containing protein [Rhodococcus antarcticus]|uniref:AbrB/MazE/SpoVT family DNA-binding domain-containing protein n=1 Tax=Rhodococcus antarcticus TaxID=2987751 RepID=A0ABY6NZU5_9NOCA|nr:AbrB/MazE/SpoVT family DNA-binding domain-containing protein [Rhodococcus antarcticus]UZJ24942.1 AbrB/MazE/SpoVT family DNA-binding domain-containing protein [Rhodococcus antarcticus]
MHTTIDAAGRIVIPKALRDAVGLTGGSSVDVSVYGGGLQVTPTARTATLRRVDGHLVVEAAVEFTDDVLFGLIDDGRR